MGLLPCLPMSPFRARKLPLPLRLSSCLQYIDAKIASSIATEPETSPPELRGWADQSGNGHDVTATGGRQYLSGIGAVSTAAAGLLRCDSLAVALGSAYTIVWCGNTPSSADWKQPWCLLTSYNVHLRTQYSGNREIKVGASSEVDTGIQLDPGGGSATKVYVVTVDGTTVEVWANSVRTLSTTLSNMGGPGTQFAWLSYVNGANGLPGVYFYAGVVYGRALGDSEIAGLTNYLLTRHPDY